MTTRKISISTLSPVHIGCDEVFEPSNFVIHNELLHALDVTALAAELNESERTQLLKLTDARDPIPGLQRFFKTNAQRFSEISSHQVAVASGIAQDYEDKMGRNVQQGTGASPTYSMFPIARTAFSPINNAPYLPGSSLKGSIRTAWLNKLLKQKGNPLTRDDPRDKNKHKTLQERLLGYTAGKFENDPFRLVAVSDAHPDAETDAPPTRVVYAISKKKRFSDRIAPELKVFLETLPEALPATFLGEIRLGGDLNWLQLCEACNRFYMPQLEAELRHDVLGTMLDQAWRKTLTDLLKDELAELDKAKQGFLLRVGKHSGAESVTVEAPRSIKILGKKGEPPSYRPETTEKRFASQSKAGANGLLPFGWIWVDASDDEHRHLFDAVRQKLALLSNPIREAHQHRLSLLEEQRQQKIELTAKHQATKAMEKAAQQAKEAALAAMSPAQRKIEEFKTTFAARVDQLRGSKEKQHADFHTRAKKIAEEALASSEWSADEKLQLANAIADWLPKVVEKIDKDALKKLKLSTLRGL